MPVLDSVGMVAGCGLIAALAVTPVEAQDTGHFDSGADNRLGLTFSPDGNVAFWSAWDGAWGSSDGTKRSILTAQRRNGHWSEPEVAKVSGTHADNDPFVSPGGRWLYFVSRRPTSEYDEDLDANIWRYSLVDGGAPELISVNSDDTEYSPVVTSSGNLYFASDRAGGPGRGDLYLAKPDGQGFHAPEPMGLALNSATGEWNLWVSENDDEIIFEASSRATNVSIPGDLYYSWLTPAGWTAAVPVTELNSEHSDLMPRLHPTEDKLYYTTAPIGGHASIESVAWTPIRERLRNTYAPTLLVANRSSHEVMFVNLSEGAAVASLETGEGPHLLSNVENERIVATGYGRFPRPHHEPVSERPPFVSVPNSRLTVIDTRHREIILDTVVDGCARPHSSWIVGETIYVTCEDEKVIRVLNLANGETQGQLDTLQEGSHVLAFEPGARVLSVSNTSSGSVTLIDIDNGSAEVRPLDRGSEGAMAIDSRVWVANAIDGSVSIVDPSSSRKIGHINAVCRFPIAFGENQHDLVWVACFASAELVAIDRESHSIKHRIKLEDQPLNLIVHPDRHLAYVSYPRKNAVAEIDLDAGTELRRIAVGIEPDGLRWAPHQP